MSRFEQQSEGPSSTKASDIDRNAAIRRLMARGRNSISKTNTNIGKVNNFGTFKPLVGKQETLVPFNSITQDSRFLGGSKARSHNRNSTSINVVGSYIPNFNSDYASATKPAWATGHNTPAQSRMPTREKARNQSVRNGSEVHRSE